MKKNTPKIRFAGFTDAWEQRKLGEMAESFEYGLNAAAKEYDGKNKYLRITDIDGESRLFKKNSLTSPDINLTSAGNYQLIENDLLFARTGASVGKTYLYSIEDGIVYFAGFLIRAKIKPQFSAEFIYQNTLTARYEKYIKITSQRSGQPGINAQEYANFILGTPKIKEQQKIGNFFKQLDDTITLHQQQLDSLKQLKLAYLQQLFPKSGEQIPKIRFANFESQWEEHKLGSITESFSGGTPAAGKAEYYGGEVPFIRSGEISSNSTELFITDSGLNNSSAKLVEVGDILYALYGATSGEVSISRISGAINQAILAIRPTHADDSYMIFQWLKKQKETIISTYLQGGQGNLSGSIVRDLVINLPKDKSEQTRIGDFFRQLDNTITLHQFKLDKLKSIKQSLLQKMFI